VERVLAADGDHLLGKWAHGACFGEGGFDAFVFDEAADLVGEQRFSVGGRAAEFDGFFLVTHGVLAGGFFGDFDNSAVEFLTKS
jgi:hypothetical protein